MINKILICTPAINRINVHNITFKKIYNKIIESGFDFQWVIHIDIIDKLKDSIHDTTTNLLSIFNNDKRYH